MRPNLLHIHIQIKKNRLAEIMHLYIPIQFYIKWYFQIQIYTKFRLISIIKLYIFIQSFIWRYLLARLSPAPENIILTINCHNLYTWPRYIKTLSEKYASKTNHVMEKHRMERATHARTGKKYKYCDTKTWYTSRNWAQTKET